MLWFLTTDLKWRRLLMFPQFADKEIKIRVVKLLAKNHWPSMSEPKSACVHACLLSHLSHVQPLQPYGLQPTRLPCLWDSSGKNTGVGWHVLLQGIFLTQRLNVHLLCLLHWHVSSFPHHRESPKPKSTWLQTSLSLVHATLKILKLGDIFLMTPKELWSMDHCKRQGWRSYGPCASSSDNVPSTCSNSGMT